MSSRRRGRICVLMSGGLDSGVLLARSLGTARQVLPLYVRCGLSWERTELSWLRRFLRAVRSPGLQSLRVIEMPLHSLYGPHWSLTGRHVPSASSADRAVYLPGRNALLLSAAAIVCAQQHIPTIALGILQGNPFGDASARFLAQMARCLTDALRYPIRVRAPLSGSTKRELIHSSHQIPLALTFSCLQPRAHQHCGRCNKCAERSRAFRQAGVPDPTIYAR